MNDERSYLAQDADIDREREAAYQNECDRDEWVTAERRYSPLIEESEIDLATRRAPIADPDYRNLAISLANQLKEAA